MSHEMMTPDERLVYMANQIARNFAGMGDGAAAATADHIAHYWDPRMKAKIAEMTAQLDPPAAAAIRILMSGGGAPAHQTLATTNGGSDAG